jgi:vancomycin resistance protein YoaR
MNNTVASAPAIPGTSTTEHTTFWTWPRVTLAVIFTLSVIAVGTMLGLFASWKNSGLIAPGIVVQGESLGGLSKDEAQARLEKRFGRLFVSLETPDRPYKLALRQLGGEVLVPQVVEQAYWYGRSGSFVGDAWKYWTSQRIEQRRALPIRWEKDTLRKTMWTVATDYNRAPRDAKLEVNSNGIEVIPEESGRAMNVGATCATLQKQYFAGKPAIKATTETTAPRLAAADLAGRDVLLGKYTTTFNSGLEGRTENIRLASTAIDGKVLMPNERFSFNAMTGERTPAKGYRVAHIFVRKPGQTESEVVDGVGGGVCQVSSTLYNAVRKTNNQTDDKLAIVERNNHSLPVTYVPSGLDATVAWPSKDFRFRNTFAHPVYIRTEMSGSRLTISIWGRVPDNVESVTVSEEKQASTPEAGTNG